MRTHASQLKNTMAARSVTDALRLLADAAADREHELNCYSAQPDNEDSDEDNGSDCPVFDKFYENGGSAAISAMTNFNPGHLERLWKKVEPHTSKFHNVGRGRKSLVSAKDIFP